jgi:uncharacterized protein (TIGR02687 family)
MDTKQLNDNLDKIFNEEKARIVFWHDPGREFVNSLPFIMLENVELIRLEDASSFEVKLLLERQRPNDRFLLYSATEEPELAEDWLLDIRLYSRSFRADRASIILDDLGLTQLHLRDHIAARRKFFDNKERIKKLKGLVAPNDTAADLDRKMLAVVVGAEQPEIFTIVRTLFHAFLDDSEIDLAKPPAVWEQIEKFDLAQPFWQFVNSTFGYEEESPSLRNFLVRLLVTEFDHQLRGDLPKALEHLVLPQSGCPNTVVCLAGWRDSSSQGSSYDVLAQAAAAILHLEDHLDKFEIENLLDVTTFLEVEKAIVRLLRDRVSGTTETLDAEEIRQIAARRQDGHWASLTVSGSDTVPRQALNAVYEALVAAADFFALRNRYGDGFHFDSPEAMYLGYESELHRFDQLYRHFCCAADQAESQSWDVLKKLREQIEAVYCNWFLTNVALAWGDFMDKGLLAKWQIAGRHNQYEFYEQNVQKRLDEAENRKAFVIVSDALRYEAAHELCQELNGKYRFEAELTSQLGVLPSYTGLGMAALLPHERLTYRPNGEILVDDRPTASSAQRNDVLDTVEGMTCQAKELLAMKKDEGRKHVAGKKVVYVYHDTIDATGEKPASEHKTFHAVRQAIEELADLVAYVVNNLNANYVVVTADHGFIFTETAPGETDRSSLSDKPPGAVMAKKRFLLSPSMLLSEITWQGSTAITAKAEGGMQFWTPKGFNRFHFLGSKQFIHGGAMLQEIVVPVITVRHKKDKAVREETKTKQVTVHVLGANHKVTTSRHRFEMIQMEPVSDRVKPVTLKVAVYEGEEPVTNVVTITFDSSSDKMEDRKKAATLTLVDRQYNKKTLYRLILRDAETLIEQQSVEVTIDRAFTDDF